MVGQSPSILTKRLDEEPPTGLYLVDVLNPLKKIHEILQAYLHTWSRTWPETDGNVLRQMNIPPGPLYRQLLWSLRSAWLDGKITSPEEEKQLLEELIHQLPDKV